MKKIFILISIFVVLGTYSISLAAQNTGYQPLAPIPGFTQTEGINDSDIGGYLKQLYVFGVGLASILAVMMIMWGGVEYMTTDAIGHKEEGKQKIQSAIMGLILAFGSFVILRTINADLVNINFSLWKSNLSVSKIETPVVNNSPYSPDDDNSGAISVGNDSAATGNKIPIDGSIKIKGESGNLVDATLAPKLKTFNEKMDQAGINWRVTEAWPPVGYSAADPTGIHSNACHGTGMCVDGNFTGSTNATASNINTFSGAASQSGLRAVYEVSSESRKNELIASGVKGEIQIVKSITAEHFSVYNK